MGADNYVTSYTYDKNNRLLRESKVNIGSSYADLTIYSYDNNGNLVRKDKSKNNLDDKPVTGFYSESEIENTGYGYEKFTYNGLNQLVKFEDEKKNTTDYTYWSDGLRLSKSVNGSKTNFMWDGDQLMMTVTDEETRSYTKALGYMRSGTSKELDTTRNDIFYLFNGHGDVTALTDKTGTATKTYEYDAFGNEINPSTTDTNPFRYCGEYYDSETGSIYLRARYYNPSIGRFTAEDPIKDGLNWYAYCGGNPVMFVDPSGNRRAAYTDSNGVYHADPDKEEFGETSDTYKIILDLEKRYQESDDQTQKDYYARLANLSRDKARRGTPYKYGEDLVWNLLNENTEEAFEYIELYNENNKFGNGAMLSPYFWFVDNTCNIWDYKTYDNLACPYEWFNDMYITHIDNKHRTTEWIYFDGILISADDIGNLNLGYVGTKMGYKGFLLLNPTTEDSEHDSDIIRYGIALAGR